MFEVGLNYGLEPGEVLRRMATDRCYPTGNVITRDMVRQRLGGVKDSILIKLIDHRGMPAPLSVNPPVWNNLEWHCWFWSTRDQHRTLLKSDWSGNVSASPCRSAVDYQRQARNWIRNAANAKGRSLTHEITVGFRNKTGQDDDPELIKRLNDRERSEIGKLCKKLPRFVMRGFGNFGRGPQRSFFHCITPECHNRFGSPVRWHFHVELFLTRRETKRVTRHWAKIENQIMKCLRTYAGEREIDIQLRQVDQHFSEYVHKDAEDNIAIMVSNLLEPSRK